MTGCTGGPAEEFSVRYLNGTLSEMDSARFEDHYFACAECHEALEALRAIQDRLSRNPIPIPVAESRRTSLTPVRMPVRVVVWGSLAAVLVVGAVVVGVVAYRDGAANRAGGVASANTPAASSGKAMRPPDGPAPELSPAATAAVEHGMQVASLEKLADRKIPGFSEPELRGAESSEPGHTEFVAGMHLYAIGNCPGALPHLAQVPVKAVDGMAAALFMGLCQYQQKDWKRAAAGFRKVILAGDTPQLETAEYYLAQTMLELGDVAEAKTHLARTIALHGDDEDKARAQQQLLQKEVARR